MKKYFLREVPTCSLAPNKIVIWETGLLSLFVWNLFAPVGGKNKVGKNI